MVRIAAVNIPDNKKIEVALTYIFGVGNSLSKKILYMANVDANLRAEKLTREQIERITQILEKNYKTEGDLRLAIAQNIKRLKEIKTYRGLRHIKNLPVRGQHTRTNARTKRGKKMTVGSGRKRATEKT